jgi:hypothetical protein
MSQKFLSQARTIATQPQPPIVNSSKPSLHPIPQLQAKVGNRAVNQTIATQLSTLTNLADKPAKPLFQGLSHELMGNPQRLPIQAKLVIGQPGDRYEQEADRIASQAVNQIHASQRHVVQHNESQRGQIHRSPSIQISPSSLGQQSMGTKTAATPSAVESSIRQAQGGGQPLSEDIREPMEQAFGVDFSRVKVHNNPQANQLNHAIQSRAFTTGQDVFFRSGAYNPGSCAGQELIAHELTHVVQQSHSNTPQIQRVYLHDGTKITWEDDSKDEIPDGYVKANEKYNAGTHGIDSLYIYQPSTPSGSTITATNSFSSNPGFGSRMFSSENVVAEDTEDESDVSKVNAYYLQKIIDLLEQSKQSYLNKDDSSSSEMEVGVEPQRRSKRRNDKASQLAAIAKTFFPIDSGEQTFREGLIEKRQRDNKDRAGKRQMYAKDTREAFAQIGEQFKQTNLEHNVYFRRAFRCAVPSDKVEEGGSANYNSNQKKIRDELKKVIVSDHAIMQWDRRDFQDDQTWDAVKWMLKNVISNASKGDSYYERMQSNMETSDSQPRMAFHHIGWKEAVQQKLVKYALHPANLSALNDLRELLNPKKIKALEAEGASLPPVGAHDAFGHQGSGFTQKDQDEFERSLGGGQFKDIDLEAVYYILLPNLKPRTKKRDLYAVTKSPPSSLSAPLASSSIDQTPTKKAKSNPTSAPTLAPSVARVPIPSVASTSPLTFNIGTSASSKSSTAGKKRKVRKKNTAKKSRKNQSNDDF